MYGIGPQKTFSAEVKSTYLMKNRFFWAGFIDGDGSIHQGVPNKNQIRFSLSAVSGSYKLIAQFKDFIFAETKISLTITAVNKKSPNYVFSLGGKKAIRVMQLLYSDNPYALSRKSELARIAANRYAVDLDGDIIDWRTATGYDHIWFEKNPRVINRKYRVTGPNDIHIGSFSDLETAILARDYFYELLANELTIKEAKTKVIERFEEYFPRSYYAAESAVRYDKKRQVYICRLYYQTRIPGKKGMDIYILEHANKQLVQAVDAIAKNLRQAGYVYEGRRARIEQGGFLYEHSIPQNWKNILIEHGVPDKKITGLEETIISVWNNISPLN